MAFAGRVRWIAGVLQCGSVAAAQCGSAALGGLTSASLNCWPMMHAKNCPVSSIGARSVPAGFRLAPVVMTVGVLDDFGRSGLDAAAAAVPIRREC